MNFAGHACIFELAVYRVDYETWERESAELEKRFVVLIPAWAYNDVVGWLRLSTSFEMIKAYLQWRDAKRLVRPFLGLSDKFFVHRGKVFELRLHRGQTDLQIYEALTKQLHQLSRRAPFKGRYVDVTALKAIGPRVSWRALVGLSP